MAYLPSHQELATHPKTRKAARRAAVSIPTMIGHLHLLWWWALDHAPDGELGKYDAEDLADAALWEGDPEAFVKALRACGSGDGEGFLHDDGTLHDWDDYGGKYGKRVQAARKAAAARWHSDDDADAMRTHSEGNADASDAQCDDDAAGNAEERRGEEHTPVGDGEPFATRLSSELKSNHAWGGPPDGATTHEAFHALLATALERLPDDRHHDTTLGIIAGYVARCGAELTREARSHTARLVTKHPATAVLHAWDQALEWGAGIGDEWAEDPLAMSKYAAKVLSGEKRGAA